ncbi:hypothetical protein AAC387_Pa03g3948 [Persea americana]
MASSRRQKSPSTVFCIYLRTLRNRPRCETILPKMPLNRRTNGGHVGLRFYERATGNRLIIYYFPSVFGRERTEASSGAVDSPPLRRQADKKRSRDDDILYSFVYLCQPIFRLVH